jgi:UDPglucose 6-dehydrogenase
MGRNFGVKLSLVSAVLEVNARMRSHWVQKIKLAMECLENKTIAILGLSFKPNTDDIRESPAIEIALDLLQQGVKLKVYDPVAMSNARRVLNGENLEFCSDAYAALACADGMVVATEWNEFRNLSLEKAKELLRHPLIFDMRNVFDPEKASSLGFRYFATGRC